MNRRDFTFSAFASAVWVALPHAAAEATVRIHAKTKELPTLSLPPRVLKDLPPQATCVMDARTCEIIVALSRNSYAPCHPASLTKLMTTLLVFERLASHELSPKTTITFSKHAASQGGKQHNLNLNLGLPPASTISVQNAIIAMHVFSFNDVAAAMGEHVAQIEEKKADKGKNRLELAAIRMERAIKKKLEGGAYYENRFAELMTAKAGELDMAATTFANASGLPDPNQITTARDMAFLTNALLDEKFAHYHDLMRKPIFSYNGAKTYSRYDHVMNTKKANEENVNILVAKTGRIDEAGFNLAVCAEEKGARKGAETPRVVVVVMGEDNGKDRASEALKLIAEGVDRIKTAPNPSRPPAQGQQQPPSPATANGPVS